MEVDGGAAVFGVFDGHGGKEVAIYAARHFVQLLTQNPRYQTGNYETALLGSGRAAADSPGCEGSDLHTTGSTGLCSCGWGHRRKGTEDCTAVVALLQDSTLYVANAGDSRAVLGRKGKAVEISLDHKPDLPEELARITAAEPM